MQQLLLAGSSSLFFVSATLIHNRVTDHCLCRSWCSSCFQLCIRCIRQGLVIVSVQDVDTCLSGRPLTTMTITNMVNRFVFEHVSQFLVVASRMTDVYRNFRLRTFQQRSLAISRNHGYPVHNLHGRAGDWGHPHLQLCCTCSPWACQSFVVNFT